MILSGSYSFFFFLTFFMTLPPANVAARGVATQSAEPASDATGPRMAINYYSNPNSTEENCASVPKQDNPWWRLDLMSIYRITAVSVVSAGDCCSEELDRAEVRIGLRDDTSNPR